MHICNHDTTFGFLTLYFALNINTNLIQLSKWNHGAKFGIMTLNLESWRWNWRQGAIIDPFGIMTLNLES